MSLSSWIVTGLASVGENWEISINNSAGTSRTGNINLFNETFGGGDMYVKINSGVRKFKMAQPIGSGTQDFKILTQKPSSDYYYFPPFIAWDSWTMTSDGWRPTTPTVTLETETGTANSTIDIYPSLPLEWQVSGAPASWDVATQSGSLTMTGRRTDGSPLTQLESDAFINTFLNPTQSIYLSGVEAEVVSNSGANFISPIGNVQINIKDSRIQPVGDEVVNGASIYSTIDSDSTPLNETYVVGNYPRSAVLINYEFLSGTSYSGDAIISSLPSLTTEFSGRVVGNSALTGDYRHRAHFDGESYIAIENATGLEFQKGFVFIFDVERLGTNPSTIFSNLGPFNDTAVSGWEIGFNSAGYETFTYYGDFLPKTYTATSTGPARGLYCAGVSNNTLGLGRFDFNSLSVEMDHFPLDNKFIRESNDWKIGSGEYVFSGYMDSFLYMDYLPTANMVENIMESYLYSGFATPTVVRTLPPQITGYTGYCSGTTGTIWFTGQLSGQTTGIYTGYNFTGTGVTGGLTLKGSTNLYASGDLYSGLYIHNPLLWFELNTTGTGYYEVTDPLTYTPASLAWNPRRKTLFTVDNNTSVVTELNRRRQRVRNLTGNLNDPEGICYMSGDIMGFLDSADPYNSNGVDRASIFYTEINEFTTGLGTGFMTKIETTVDGSAGNGLVGITCDVERSCFYGVTVSSTLYQIDFDGTTTQKPAFTSLAGLGDYSDLHYQSESDSLFIISSGGLPDPSIILQTSLDAEIWYSGDAQIKDAVGITLTNNNQKMYAISSTGPIGGASWSANQNKVINYEFLQKETGYTSGDFTQNAYIYQRQYKTGLGLTGTTGFLTGLEEFKYTGYTDVFLLSGITGYDGNSGCIYNPISGDIAVYQVSSEKNINLLNSDAFTGYLYDRIGLMGNCEIGDLVEVQSPLFSPGIKYTNSGYGLYGQNVAREGIDPGTLNVVGNYGFDDKLGRPGFYINTSDSLTSGAHIYLNGMIQQTGTIKYITDKFYNKIPYVEGGGYAVTGTQIFDSGTGFLSFNAITDDILYADLRQPTETSGVISQKEAITDTNQYLDPVTLGISGLYNEIFLNGRHLYEGANRDYVISNGHYFHATGNTTGVTGVLYTIPTNTGLVSYTGDGPSVFAGAFLDNNIGWLNGLRWPRMYAEPFSSACSLLSGNQRISSLQEMINIYDKEFIWPQGTKAFSRINPHYDWTWSGVNTGTGGGF